MATPSTCQISPHVRAVRCTRLACAIRRRSYSTRARNYAARCIADVGSLTLTRSDTPGSRHANRIPPRQGFGAIDVGRLTERVSAAAISENRLIWINAAPVQPIQSAIAPNK